MALGLSTRRKGRAQARALRATSKEIGKEAGMTHKEWLRRMCEYPISISLIGEIEPIAPETETALERAHRIWGMTSDEESEGNETTRDR
jgi:hypothetical protein